MIKITAKTLAIASTVTLLTTALGMYVWGEEHRLPALEVYVFSLKSGNSFFIRTPDDMRYIINGGANSEIIRHITKILPFYSHRIDAVFATDVDPKNVGGLISIIERYGTEKVYLPSENIYTLGLDTQKNDAYKVFIDTVTENSIPVQQLGNSEELRLGNSGDVTLEILFPSAAKTSDSSITDDLFEYSKASPPQLIMRIVQRSKNTNKSILLFGSASKKIQKAINTSKSDVLAISNGASEVQLDSGVIEKVAPRYVVYSKNDVSSKKSASEQKMNPLFANILPKNRFNIKEGIVRIVINEGQIDIDQDN